MRFLDKNVNQFGSVSTSNLWNRQKTKLQRKQRGGEPLRLSLTPMRVKQR